MGDRGEGESRSHQSYVHLLSTICQAPSKKHSLIYILLFLYIYSYSIKRALASNTHTHTHTPCAHTYHDDHVHTTLPLLFPTPSLFPLSNTIIFPNWQVHLNLEKLNELPFFAMPVGVNRFHLGLAVTTHDQTVFSWNSVLRNWTVFRFAR